MLQTYLQNDDELFHFFTALEKGGVKEEDGERLIEGTAATPDRDTQGETVLMDGLDLTYFWKYGKINWEHKKEPAFIIGEPVSGNVNPKRFHLRSRLYKGLPIADQAWLLAKATDGNERPALGFSVEGKVLERDPRDQTKILRAMVVNVALTANPVNTNTFADVVKSFAGLEKGLDTVSGAPLMPQSLEGGIRDLDYARLHRSSLGKCRCMDAAGFIHGGYAGALYHGVEHMGLSMEQADQYARNHRQIAESTTKGN